MKLKPDWLFFKEFSWTQTDDSGIDFFFLAVIFNVIVAGFLDKIYKI